MPYTSLPVNQAISPSMLNSEAPIYIHQYTPTHANMWSILRQTTVLPSTSLSSRSVTFGTSHKFPYSSFSTPFDRPSPPRPSPESSPATSPQPLAAHQPSPVQSSHTTTLIDPPTETIATSEPTEPTPASVPSKQKPENSLVSGLLSVNPDPNAWWNLPSIGGTPWNQFSGRSMSRLKKNSLLASMGAVMGEMTKSGMRAELMRWRFHERPSEEKRRRRSERHRRRFQEMVREKVRLVNILRTRN
ncbi:hypothetical protein M231_00296 [Tremella mesenterica]|uniref:Uncharacterized protein n=1 Tax=Tremella mesenterica TaxID=5217 RepID=A0A4Q1BW73_TREME|nr:hypothetical protein M231_00296 [Tremella mesenterica]